MRQDLIHNATHTLMDVVFLHQGKAVAIYNIRGMYKQYTDEWLTPEEAEQVYNNIRGA